MDMDTPGMQYPTNTQELFDLAVQSTRVRHSEFGNTEDLENLYSWARAYALSNGLKLPTKEDCGLWE
jgi:hypothetical protein